MKRCNIMSRFFFLVLVYSSRRKIVVGQLQIFDGATTGVSVSSPGTLRHLARKNPEPNHKLWGSRLYQLDHSRPAFSPKNNPRTTSLSPSCQEKLLCPKVFLFFFVRVHMSYWVFWLVHKSTKSRSAPQW